VSENAVYLDHAATTPKRPQVLEEMLPYLGSRFGNPSGVHATARQAARAVDEARETVAAALGADPGEIVFTSGGTEANNLAVVGVQSAIGGTVLASAIEHPSVLAATAAVGGRVVPANTDGQVDLPSLARACSEQVDDVCLVSVMLVNNEIGTVQPVQAVAELLREEVPRARLHVDAVQGFPWLDLAREAPSASFVTVSAHKFGGPKGVGALVVRAGASPSLAPILHGGGQERDRRSGTHNVAGIVGMAAAAAATVAEREATAARVAALRDRLADGLLARLPGCEETGPRERKTPAICHLRFPGVDSEELLVALDREGVAASAGSACASGALEPSHVLLSIGRTRLEARESVRFSLGHTTTDADIDAALALVPTVVERLAPVRTRSGERAGTRTTPY
jgi:cysteine desulfurase